MSVNGCPSTCSKTVRVFENCVNGICHLEASTQNTIHCGEVIPPMPTSVTADGVVLTNYLDSIGSHAGTASDVIRTFSSANGDYLVAYELIVEDQSTCLLTAHCSLTQGFYGNAKGKFMGVPGYRVLTNLLDDVDPQTSQPGLMVGLMSENRSVQFTPDSALCLIRNMPAGGSSGMLPDGNHIFSVANDGSCTNSFLPLDKKNKFRNVLFGQVITLTLNTRLDLTLGSFQLSPQFCTVPAIPAFDPNGAPLYARFTPDTNAVARTQTISAAILGALTAETLPSTVTGLLQLANRGLAGLSTGGATLSEINSAVSAINEGFDGCRFVVPCKTQP